MVCGYGSGCLGGLGIRIRVFRSVVDPDQGVLVGCRSGSGCFVRLWIQIRVFWSVVDPDQGVSVGCGSGSYVENGRIRIISEGRIRIQNQYIYYIFLTDKARENAKISDTPSKVEKSMYGFYE